MNKMELDEAFFNENMCIITYDAVREACNDAPFTMKLVGKDAEEVQQAINTNPIDAHLEACFVPDRGDSYEYVTRKISNNGRVVSTKLECTVSVESLPVLLRRLFERDPCSSIGAGILTCLGFNEDGQTQ